MPYGNLYVDAYQNLSCILQKQEDHRALGFSSEMAVRKVREKHHPAHKPALILIGFFTTQLQSFSYLGTGLPGLNQY